MALHSYAFVTLAEVKTQLDISDTSEDDKLTFLINAATDLVERYCGRRFIETAHADELYTGQDTNQLQLKNTPINDSEVLTIEVEDEEIDVEAVDYINGIVELASVAIESLSNIKATYTGGYLLADIPFDLKQAVIMLVSKGRNVSKNIGIASESVGEYSVAYQRVQGGLTDDIKAILINYKRF